VECEVARSGLRAGGAASREWVTSADAVARWCSVLLHLRQVREVINRSVHGDSLYAVVSFRSMSQSRCVLIAIRSFACFIKPLFLLYEFYSEGAPQ
jgi:hypothetical protein